MRLTNIPCGCEARKEVMFTEGKLGVSEATILAASVLAIIIAWRLNRAP